MTEEATTADTAPAPADTAPVDNAPATQATDTQETTTEAPATTDTAVEDGARAPINDGETKPDFTLPDEHKDKPWAPKVKSQDDLYKQIDNLNELIGKKTIAPIDYETATPEEISAYHSSLAPENISDYEFGEGGDPDFEAKVGETFQKYGIDKHQAKGLSADINAIAGEMVGAQQKADTSEEGYFKIMEDSFGEDYKTTVGIIEKSLKEHVASDEDKSALDAMDNNTRAVVDRTVHSLTKAYEDRIAKILNEHGVTESGSQVEGETGVNTGVDVNEVRADLRNKIAEIGNRPHTAEDLQGLKDKLNATYR